MGKERDEETGLYYYGARYYAPWIQRFISTDPLKDEYPFYSSYQYAGNKPIIAIDIDGLESSAEVGQQDTPELKAVESKPANASRWDSENETNEAILEYEAGLAVGIGEGVYDLAKLGLRASPAGTLYDLAVGNDTIQGEIIEGVGLLIDTLSSQEGRENFVEAIKILAVDFLEDSAFQNGAFDAGKAHGKIAFDAILTVATGGELGAVKFARLFQNAIKDPKALANVLKASIKNVKNLEVDLTVLNSGLPKLRKVGSGTTDGIPNNPGVVRRFVSKAEAKDLKRNGFQFDPEDSRGGLSSTSISIKPVNPDKIKRSTGAFGADSFLDIDVSKKNILLKGKTKSGLPDFKIQSDIAPSDIINSGRVRKK